MEPNHVAVQCRGLVKSYGAGDAQAQSLRGVDLGVRYGELLMLVGPSGSGKTTLLSIMAGILDQDDGRCVVLDHDFRRMNATERARFRGRTIGFVFQGFNLLPSLTVADNVAAGYPFWIMWFTPLFAGVMAFLVSFAAAALSARPVWKLQPATVFAGP